MSEADPKPPTEGDAASTSGALAWCRENPFTVAVFLLSTAAGSLLALHYEIGPADMPLWKRALGGAIGGAWLAMFPMGFRLFQ